MTVKINNFTIFKNKFSSTGRIVNKQISQIQLEFPEAVLYQRRFNNGNIGILFEEKVSSGFSLVSARGVIAKTGTLIRTNGSLKFYDRVKDFYNCSQMLLKQIKNSVIYNLSTKKTEEVASYSWNIDGPVDIIVRTKFGRKSEFPKTITARNLHPGVAQKMEYSNGDIVYWEHYMSP